MDAGAPQALLSQIAVSPANDEQNGYNRQRHAEHDPLRRRRPG